MKIVVLNRRIVMPFNLKAPNKKATMLLFQRSFGVFSFFLFLSDPVQSQNLYFKKYQVEQGLSHNSIYNCLQDKHGYMWFGSLDGLNRYDGYEFKVFRAKPEDSTSMRSNFILSMQEDASGLIWIGTANGLYVYNEKKENFSLLWFSKDKEVRDIKFDSDGNVWCIVQSSVYKYTTANKQLLEIGKGIIDEATSLLCINNSIWIANNRGNIFSYNQQLKSITAYDAFANKGARGTKRIEKIYCADGNTILIGTVASGVMIFDIKNKLFNDFISLDPQGSNLYVRNFLHTGNSEYWIGTESGLVIANTSNKEIKFIQKNVFDPYTISDNAIYALCKDREGGVWIGTYFGGVNYYSSKNSLFKKYFSDNTNNTINGSIVREIVKDKYNNLWVGTEDGGLNKINSLTGKRLNSGFPKNTNYLNIHGLIVRDEELWVGTFEHGIDVIDIKTGHTIRNYNSENSNLQSNFIVTFYETKENDLLVGTYTGLYRFNKVTGDFDVVNEIPTECFIYGLCEDNQKRLWVATIGRGLFCISGKNKTSTNKLLDSINSLIYSKKVQRVYCDSNDNLWIATGGDGLIKIIANTDKIEHLTTKNGLSSNFVLNIIEDDYRAFWITTSKGLSRYSYTKDIFQTFTKVNGLLSDQFSYNSGFKDEHGRIYLGCWKGMISFEPADFNVKRKINRIILTDFKLQTDEKEIGDPSFPLDSSITTYKSLRLKYNESPFTLNFSPLNFENSDVVSYKYKIEGLDNRWTNLDHSQKIIFSNLPPGHYTLQILTYSSSGEPVGETFSLPLIITPPLWASKTAYVFYFFFAAAILFFLLKIYSNRMKEKNNHKIELIEHEKEKRLYESKIEFFTYVAHEIKTPLTLILGPIEKILKYNLPPDTLKYVAMMKNNTNQLLTLSKQLLDFRQTEAHGFSLSFTKENVTDLLTDCFQGFTAVAEERLLDYKLTTTPYEVHALLDKESFIKIINNLLANAIKYSNTCVAVDLKVADVSNQFIVTVKNDGFIIPLILKDKIFEPFYRIKEAEKENGSGLGLSLCKILAELHNGTIELIDVDKNMNNFVLTLPLNQGIEKNQK